jgi:hypothetical protein
MYVVAIPVYIPADDDLPWWLTLLATLVGLAIAYGLLWGLGRLLSLPARRRARRAAAQPVRPPGPYQRDQPPGW